MLLVNHREHNEPDRGDAAEREQFTTTPTTAGVMQVSVSISPDGRFLAYQEREPRAPIRGRQGRDVSAIHRHRAVDAVDINQLRKSSLTPSQLNHTAWTAMTSLPLDCSAMEARKTV